MTNKDTTAVVLRTLASVRTERIAAALDAVRRIGFVGDAAGLAEDYAHDVEHDASFADTKATVSRLVERYRLLAVVQTNDTHRAAHWDATTALGALWAVL